MRTDIAIVNAVLPLTACPNCDLLQRVPDMTGHTQVKCVRCGAILLRRNQTSPAHSLALTVTAAILFVIANVYPIATLDSQGTQVSTTLLGAVALLWQSGMMFIALLVFATTILSPGAEIALLLAVLSQRAPSARILRWMECLRPWSMIDVFVLGIIVAIKKLADMAIIIPGAALWAFCTLMLLITLIRSSGDLTGLWARVSYPGQLHVR